MQTATITSKRQLTIPIKTFKKAGLSVGDKVVVKEEDGKIIIESQQQILDKLAGFFEVPEHLKGIEADEAIRTAKKRHFNRKYSKDK